MKYLLHLVFKLISGVEHGSINAAKASRCIENAMLGHSVFSESGDSSIFDQPISALGLSVRATNLLTWSRYRDPPIMTVRQLVSSDVYALTRRHGMGSTILEEICTKLREKQLYLGILPPLSKADNSQGE